jgi:hypothetical protein
MSREGVLEPSGYRKNRSPSKRYKPREEPIQRYPSLVCASVFMPPGAPSRRVHAVWVTPWNDGAGGGGWRPLFRAVASDSAVPELRVEERWAETERGFQPASTSTRPKAMCPQAIEPVVFHIDSRGWLLCSEVERHAVTNHYSRPEMAFCIHTKVLLAQQPKEAFEGAAGAIPFRLNLRGRSQ